MKQLDTYQKSDENHKTCWDLSIYNKIFKPIDPLVGPFKAGTEHFGQEHKFGT
jgi:hypothetical protein